MLLDSLGHHVQLTKLDANKEEKLMFPTNTIDDVVVDDSGNTLDMFIPTITTDASVIGSSAMTCIEIASDQTIEDVQMAALLENGD